MTDLRTYRMANDTIRRKSIGIVLSKIDENLCKQTVAICSNLNS